MSYDNTFYQLYQNYLEEHSVRDSHDWMFGVIYHLLHPGDVLDLGCGHSMEFFHYGSYMRGYKGIDLNAEIPNIRADYRTFDFSDEQFNDITFFISLFSSEITAPHQENYKLYERIFKELPNLRNAVVSGFYYPSKKNENPIGEAGGLVSYQTLERIEDVESKIFSEKRIVMPVPSKLFGPDVVEVWKILQRNF
jgi:hypothetical protein